MTRSTSRGRGLGALGAVVCALVLAVLSSPASAHASHVGRNTRGAPVGAVSLQPVDGGADYYAGFSPSLPSDPAFFPLAVWFESVTGTHDVEQDRAAGLNTYVQLTDNSSLATVRDAGMYAIGSRALAAPGTELVGYMVSDEVDMRFGPGWAGVNPTTDDEPTCTEGGCGYSVQRDLLAELPDDGRLRYSNYGKGVTFWETRPEARVFVNRFQDVVSADNYWFTDPNICSVSEGGTLVGDGNHELSAKQCRRASNYGATVDRVRSLVRPARSKPVWAFVEVGHPFTEDDAPTIRPAQIRAAVWSSLIHGARGVIYFNHSFGGECQTQHALRERCYADARDVVSETNHQISALAPVLNSPTVRGVVGVDGAADTMVKWSDGTYYVFAGATGDGSRAVGFTLRCTDDATATVLGEHRTVAVENGRFTDVFADANAVHLYRIDGGTTCTPR